MDVDGPVDVFLVAGQSNANGLGDPDDAPSVPAGVAYEYDPETDRLDPLAEPVGPGDGGSAWAAFAVEYYERTGRPVVLTSRAVNGAALHPDADVERGAGDWRAGGDYCRAAVDAVEGCLAALDDAGAEYEFRGLLWHQGESDAIAIHEDYHTLANYEDAFRETMAWFREALDRPDLDVFLFGIGTRQSGDDDGWRAVREAQGRFAEADPHVHRVSTCAVDFAEAGKMQDAYHYTQAGYDEMGREGARNVAALLQ